MHVGPTSEFQDLIEAQVQRADALLRLDQFAAADAEASKVLSVDAEHVGAHLVRGAARLAQGQWTRGFEDWQWRERSSAADRLRRFVRQPRWTGDPLAGRTLLVYADDDVAATVHALRWLLPLRAQSGRIVLAVASTLVPLLTVNGVADTVRALSDPVPPHDVQAPLGDLPRLLGLTEDQTVKAPSTAYLRAPRVMDGAIAAWCATQPSAGVRIGLVWSTARAGSGESSASAVPFADFLPLLGRDDVSWMSLQLGERSADLAPWTRHVTILDPSALISHAGHVAQLLTQCDAILTIDDAIAHLAGALGKRTWVLLPYAGIGWRWASGLQGAPWYGSVELIRQREPGRWDDVMAQLGARCGGLAAAPRR